MTRKSERVDGPLGHGFRPRIVFSVHGIRTEGEWQCLLAEVMKNSNIPFRSFRYGYFGFSRFLLSSSRSLVAEQFAAWFEAQVKEVGIKNLNKTVDRPSVIAHSFGSLVVAQALLKYREIKLDKLILCGALIPCNFDWSSLIKRNQIYLVRNEISRRDIWADLVRYFVSGTGPSGRVGFTVVSPRCRNEKYEKYGHCDYLTRLHFERSWLPVLRRDPREIVVGSG